MHLQCREWGKHPIADTHSPDYGCGMNVTCAPQREHQPNTRQRILVVDDERDIRQLNAEGLGCAGYQVDTAEDGAAAWEALQLQHYDLLITDNEMPKLSGVGLLQHLHAAQLTLPVIMATGSSPEEELAQQPWLPIEAVLLKPYTMEELLDVVKNVLHTANSGYTNVAAPNWAGQPLAHSLRC